MNILKNLIKKAHVFQRTIGLSIEQFNILLEKLSPIWKESEEERKTSYKRQRRVGAGHPYKLESLEHKVLLVLLYYKLYLTQECLGVIIDLDQANISRLLKKMLPLIEKAADPELATYLTKIQEKYKQAEKTNDWSKFFEKHPELKDVSTDATEQETYRSQDNEKQRLYYSGKKKKHMVKVQISTSSNGRILDISETYPGSVHDKTIIDKEKTITKFPIKTCQRFDSGYQGIQKDHSTYYLVLPIKRLRKQELSPLAKEHNRVHSIRRIIVEHIFSRLKKFRICGQLYRGKLSDHNQIFRNVSSIINFKLAHPALVM